MANKPKTWSKLLALSDVPVADLNRGHRIAMRNGDWKHIWITGASSGLGEHTARLLAEQGYQVSISARSADKLDAIANGFENVTVYPADVTDADALKRTVAEAEAAHGSIDLALFCAGAWFQSSVKNMNTENFSKTLDVNVMGVVNALDAVLPQMFSRKAGHVAWVSSVAGYGGLPNAASYGSSKAALINMAESMKPELNREGITVSVVNPGFVRTPMTDKNKFPMPFIMEPEDAARAIVSGLRRKKFEVAFPWQLVTILKFLNRLPYWLYFALVKRTL